MSGGQRFVYLNSRLLPAAAATVSVFDRAFAYGDALIETLKLLDGRPVFFPDHYKRLRQGMRDAAFTSTLDQEGLRNQALALAEANGVSSGRLRIMLSRGTPPSPGGVDAGVELTPTLLLTVEPFAGHPENIYSEGVDCATVDANRGRFAHLKSTSLIATVIARRQAHEAGCFEAIFTTGHGRLLEGSISNIFFHDGERLLTAPDDLPLLAGVTRQKLLEIATAAEMEIGYLAPKLDEIDRMTTSAFLTGSVLGVCPVRSIDGKSLKLDIDLGSQLQGGLKELELASLD